MTTGNKILAALLCAGALALLAVASLEDAAAWLVGIVAAGATVLLLGLNPVARERCNLVKLFCAALLLRCAFTLLLYKMGLNEAGGFGGGDETMWINTWVLSRRWDENMPSPSPYQNTFWGALTNVNAGFFYLAGLFFHLTSVKSQIALSFLNCWAGAITVVMIYTAARAAWCERAAVFAGWVACLAPSFLFWSAMSQKEVWIVLGTSMALRGMVGWGAAKGKPGAWMNLGWTLAGVLLAGSCRSYLRPLLGASTLLSPVVWRVKRPARTLAVLLGLGACLLFLATGLGVLHFDLLGFVQQRLEETRQFGYAQSAGEKAGSKMGWRSGVVLDYDVTTLNGFLMMLLVGGTYVFFSPFPWQMSGRQIAVLPELMAWWTLLAFFIAPGVIHAWRVNRPLLLTVLLYLGPLVLVNSIAFGNVFLTYRMRAQMLPFFFMLAAGGYEWHLRRREHARLMATLADPQARARHQALAPLRRVLEQRGVLERTA